MSIVDTNSPANPMLENKIVMIRELNSRAEELIVAIAQLSKASENILLAFYNACNQFQSALSCLYDFSKLDKVSNNPTNQTKQTDTAN